MSRIKSFVYSKKAVLEVGAHIFFLGACFSKPEALDEFVS